MAISATMQGLWARMFRGLVNLTTVTIPTSNAIATLGVSCFENCPNLSLDVSGKFDNVITVYGSVFRNSSGIIGDLYLPSLQTLIGEYIIQGTSIGSISSLGGISTIPASAFFSNSLTLINIPATVQSIVEDAFYGATSATIVVFATTPPSAGNTIFGTVSAQKIYVPYSADHSILAVYEAASGWSYYSGKFYELNPDGTVPTT